MSAPFATEWEARRIYLRDLPRYEAEGWRAAASGGKISVISMPTGLQTYVIRSLEGACLSRQKPLWSDPGNLGDLEGVPANGDGAFDPALRDHPRRNDPRRLPGGVNRRQPGRQAPSTPLNRFLESLS